MNGTINIINEKSTLICLKYNIYTANPRKQETELIGEKPRLPGQ